MKPTASCSIIRDAAQMLVDAQVQILKPTCSGWVQGFYAGKRSSARYVLRHHANAFGLAGRRRVATAIRSWCEYHHADFAKAQVSK